MFDGSMSMSFQTLHCPSHVVVGNIHNDRTHHRTRFFRVLAIPPSSTTLIQTDQSGNLPESEKKYGSSTASTSSGSANSLISQANTVGIIGGVSVDSSLKFLKKLVSWSSKDGEDCIPFVLCSDPVLNKELLSHERSSNPYLSRKSEIPRLDHISIVENLRHKRVFLEKSGARCVVMPCHISHSWHDKVSEGCSIPFFHMAECVAKELKEAKLKPLEAGSPLRIGVLGSNATLTAGFYEEKLRKEGFEVVLPDNATMEHTVIPATEAINRKDMEGAGNLLRIALQVLLMRAVNTVVLASDDMRDLLPLDDPLLKKCIDPMDALARTTIKWAHSAQKGT